MITSLSGSRVRCVSCVAAVSSNMGIGKNGRLPWPSLRTDLMFLKKITTEVNEQGLLETKVGDLFHMDPAKEQLQVFEGKWNAVLMGRKTWESLDVTNQPLPGRLNIVISKTLKEPPPGAHHVFNSVWSAVQMLSLPPLLDTVEEIFVLGGSDVYKEAIESSYCQRIYLTEIDKEFESDAFFPAFDRSKYSLISTPSGVPQDIIEENQIQYRFCVYEKQVPQDVSETC